MFVTVVISNIVEAEADRFAELARQHADNCVNNEPGCESFRVVRDAGEPNRFAFIETYSDEPAFQAHLASDHLNWWKDVTAGLFATDPVVVRGTTDSA